MDTTGKEWYIEVPWGRLCVLAWGDCMAPPVLLVHGKGDNAASFSPLVPFLPQTFYYVAMELPGLGKSDRLPQGMMITMHDLLCVIDVLVKHFNWKNFIYIGHGLGAILGKLFNYYVPNKITKLVEIEPIDFITVTPESFGKWYRDHFPAYLKHYRRYNEPVEMSPKVVHSQLVAALKSERMISQEIATNLVQRCVKPTPDGFVRNNSDRRYSVIPPLPFTSDWIHSVFLNKKTPILDIVSTESLKLNKFKSTLFLQDEANYPHKNFKCVEIEGSYNVHMLYPQKVAPYIGQFLLGGVNAVALKSKL